MANEQEFQQAQQDVQGLNERPSNDDLLRLYALFKQATEGDAGGERPGGFDFKAIAKYNAWENEKGKSPEQARQEYVELVNKLQG